jgi:integrase
MVSNSLVPREPNRLAAAGQAANQVASQHVFDDYQQRRSENTLRRQHDDLALFAHYLAQIGVESGDFQNDPEAWRGVTWGIVGGFVQWMLQQGYATGSINVRLSTVKTYAKLALQAGALDTEQFALIRTVSGYRHKETMRVNAKREKAGVATRKGHKKAEAVTLTTEQVRALKTHPDTPQGRRDALLMCLLLDHGLRCGEIALLQLEHFDLRTGIMRFYRPKVDKEQTHRLSADTLRAAIDYFGHDAHESGPLLRGSIKGGELDTVREIKRTTRGQKQIYLTGHMSDRAITKRVEYLGRKLGVVGLSAHDGRHSWATRAARNKTDPFALQEAGGWNSLAMPRRYVEAAKIANESVNLGND